jgi:hypothetical protein
VVTLSAQGSAGKIIINSDPASARAQSASNYTVTSDPNGNAVFTLTASEPTSVVLSVNLNGVPLYTKTVVIHAVPLALMKPLTPTVTGVTPRVKGAVISLRARSANTPFVVAIQVSIDGGRTWHSYPANSTSIVLTNLKAANGYLVIVRARNGNGFSPISRAIRFRTLR